MEARNSVRSSAPSEASVVWIEMSGDQTALEHKEFESRRSSVDSNLSEDDDALRDAMKQGSSGSGPGPVAAAPKWHRSARFIMKSLAHIANMVLRVWALTIYYEHKAWGILFTQCALELFAMIFSVHVSLQDADVRRWMASASCCMWLPVAMAIFILFGCCQIIHVKRAWARQLRCADLLHSLDEKDFLWTGPALGAEHALPIALITGVPFALVTYYGFLSLDHEDLQTIVLGFTTLSSLLVVALGVVEVDIAISGYVAKRYHFDMSRLGSQAGRLQVFYPLFHSSYRIVEVLNRVTFLMLFVFLTMYLTGSKEGKFFALAIIFVDFCLGVTALNMVSPSSERRLVHVLVGVGLLLANVLYFVDMPGFCQPARIVSSKIERWRLFEILCFGILCFTMKNYVPETHWHKSKIHEARMFQGLVVLAVTTLVHTLLRCSPMAFKLGDDLHTAVLNPNGLARVKKLMTAGPGGEMLDANARVKDAEQATPAMLAASVSNIEALRVLFGAGARLDVQNSRGETCFHYAVAGAHIDALTFLIAQKGARQVLYKHLDALRQLADKRPAERQQLVDLLELPSARNKTDQGIVTASVHPEQAQGKQLCNLFPDAVQEEVPPASQLHSVSGLVFAHAAGSLARLVLVARREEDAGGGAVAVCFDDKDGVKLESLRRVRKLGQGAAGAVIEVEVVNQKSEGSASPIMSSLMSIRKIATRPRQKPDVIVDPNKESFVNNSFNSPTSPSNGSSDTAAAPTRFAMKLQPKTQSNVEWQACSELLALRRAVHPFIVRLEQAFQTPQFFALLLEFCPGGDVNRLILSTKDKDDRCMGLAVDLTARYCGQVLLALVHMHEVLGIVYRDLKPENILIATTGDAKLADFGLAVFVGKRQKKRMSIVGTMGYLAPELIYGVGGDDEDEDEADDKVNPFKTDAYSLGVTLEVMLLGEECATVQEEEEGGRWMIPDFGSEDDNLEILRQAKETGRLQPEAHELLIGLLARDPRKRCFLTSTEVRNHSFFHRNLVCDDLETRLMPPPSPSSFKYTSPDKLDP